MNTARQLLPGVPWFDVPDPASPDLDELAHRFHLHELQIEDTRHRPQRAKVDEYGIYLFAVLKHLHAGDKPLFDDFDVFLGSDFSHHRSPGRRSFARQGLPARAGESR